MYVVVRYNHVLGFSVLCVLTKRELTFRLTDQCKPQHVRYFVLKLLGYYPASSLVGNQRFRINICPETLVSYQE